MSWFDPDSITKNVTTLAQKASQLAQETLLDDHLLLELEDLRKERDALKLKLGTSKESGITSEEMENLLKANARLQEELDLSVQKEQETSQLLSKIKSMAGEKIKRLTNQIQEMELQVGKNDGEAVIQELESQLEETLKSHQDQAKAFSIEKLELKQMVSEREKERNRLQQELADYDLQKHQELQILKDELEEQRILNNQLLAKQGCQECIEKGRIAEALMLENEKHEAKLAVYEEKIEHQATSLHNNDNEILNLNEKISQLQEIILIMEADSSGAELEEWKQKYNELVHNKELGESELKKLQASAIKKETELQNTVETLQKQIAELSFTHTTPKTTDTAKEVEELQTLLNEKTTLIINLQNQISEMKSVQSQLQNTLDLTKEKHHAAAKEVELIPELKQHIFHYQAQVAVLQQELTSVAVHDQIDLVSKIEHLEIELENANQEIKFLQSNGVGTGGESNEQVLLELQSQISAYQLEIQSLSEQLSSALERNKEIESLSAELTSSRKEISELEDKIGQNIVEMRNRSTKYELQIKELTVILDETRSRIAEKSENDDLNAELDSLKLELQNANQEISSLQAMVSAGGAIPQIDLTESMTLLQKEIAEYRNQILFFENASQESQSAIEKLSVENQSLEQERKLLAEKLVTFKETVGIKLQQEMGEVQRLQSLLEQSNQENENLMAQVQELSTHLANAQDSSVSQEMEYLQKKTVELASQVQKSEAELNRLRSYLVEVEETSTNEAISMQSTIEEYQKQIAVLEKERDDWTSANEQERELRESDMNLLADTKVKLAEMVQERSSLQSKIDQDAMTIKNLQNVLSQFEKGKDQDIQDAVLLLKKSLGKAELEAKEVTEKYTIAAKRLVDLERNCKLVGPLEKELHEKTLLVGQLRHDIVQLQSHLNEAMRIMKQGSPEDSVDRKLVSNLIIGFMATKHGDKKRFEILSLMSSILQLSEEEKAKVGLIRQPGAQISPRSSQTVGHTTAENFMDMWINFLNNETSIERRNSSSAVPPALPSPQAPNEPQSPAPVSRSWFG